MLATFVVNSTTDDHDGDTDDGICDTGNATDGFTGLCTFRAATLTANRVAGLDRVHFNIPGNGIPTINLTSGVSQFRTLTDPIIIDGTTQPAGMVELNGAAITGDGLVFDPGANGSEVRGLVMNRFGESAIAIETDDVLVAGNYLGTDVTGSVSDPDGNPNTGDEFGNKGSGVFVNGSDNAIGGTDPADRNIISGNATGVSIAGSVNGVAPLGNRVLGNFIGTDVSGTLALTNGRGTGVRVESGSNHVIGGSEPGAGNVISAGFGGIFIASDGVVVEGNLIGTDVTGTLPRGNATFGIRIHSSGNQIGGELEEQRNVISANGGVGVEIRAPSMDNVVEGNFIGTDISGTVAMGNHQYGVSITDSSGNTIGGVTGNVISGNTLDGVLIADAAVVSEDTVNNVVLGNYIGTDVGGNSALGNGRHGVWIVAASFNFIGGSLPGSSATLGNVISANAEFGVRIGDGLAQQNSVEGNRIGTNAGGTQALANGFDGVSLAAGARNNTVGGLAAEQGNLISGNLGDGVLINGALGLPANDNVILGNRIGTDVTGTEELGNGFRGVHIDQHAEFNIVGGTTTGERNIISGNIADGVVIALETATRNRVIGNYIGVASDGSTPLKNHENGVFVFDSPENEIGGSGVGEGNVISANGQAGVLIQGSAARKNVILGNHIGTDFTGLVLDPDGTPASGDELGNATAGVIIDKAPENRVGLPLDPLQAPARNVISGNEDGILIAGAAATGNLVGGNLIGVDASGLQSKFGNHAVGVTIIGASSNIIGGMAVDGTRVPGNTISSNEFGVKILGDANAVATRNVIAGNFIGTNAAGAIRTTGISLGNRTSGVFIEGAAGNFVGQDTSASEPCDDTQHVAGNRIAGNLGAGVRIEGAVAQKNQIRCNSIFHNIGIGIDLGGDGVTPNDSKDTDSGPNGLQNFPIIAVLEQIEDIFRVSGTLTGAPSTEYYLDFYATDTSTARKLEDGIQGKRYLGSHTVMTDDNGDVHFETLAGQLEILAEAEVVTATATDAEGNTSEFSNFTPDFVANGAKIRTPVLFVPGFFGSFVPEITNDSMAYSKFLLTLGIEPSALALDPILRGYDDFVASMVKAGYTKNQDLFLAPYDWRLALAPPGDAAHRDGRIDGVTAAQIIDDTYEYGIDYLGHWLKIAAQQWYTIHRQPLTNVHIVAHSMGGLLSRSYIQSSAYGESFPSSVRTDGGQLVLPVVSQLTMLGVPNRGAAVTFPTWADNFSGDLAYRIVLSKIIAQAWKLFQIGPIQGIDRSTYNLSATGIDLHFEKVKFVREYVRGMGDLLPEYPGFAPDFAPFAEFENKLLLDLNQTVRSSHRVARSVAMYGASESTHTIVVNFIGPVGDGTVVSFTDLSGSGPLGGQEWYEDVDLPTNGDGTVPLESLEALFASDSDVERIPLCTAGGCEGGSIQTDDPVKHTEIVANREVQFRILKNLGHPILFNDISTGKQTSKLFQVTQGVVPFNAINYFLDPVDALLVDADGKRLGFTEATGPLSEIPGSIWFGGQVGIGWILDEPVKGPLELQLFGLGENYSVQVSSTLGGVEDGMLYSGFLGAGEFQSLEVPVIFSGPGGKPELRATQPMQRLDLTRIDASQMRELAGVSTVGFGSNHVLVNLEAVRQASQGTGVLYARSDLSDTVDFGTGWSLTGVQFEDGVFYRVLEQDGTTLFLNGPANWQNPIDRRDVNNDGFSGTAVGDILPLINAINQRTIIDASGLLPDPPVSPNFPTPYYDVNGDGFLSPAGDVLPQINFANSRAAPEGEHGSRALNSDPAVIGRGKPPLLDRSLSDRFSAQPYGISRGASTMNMPPPEQRSPRPRTDSTLNLPDRERIFADLIVKPADDDDWLDEALNELSFSFGTHRDPIQFD